MADAVEQFLEAACCGDASEVRRLLAAGVPVGVKDSLSGCTALHYAATAGKLDGVKLLVEAGASLHDRNNTAFMTPLASAVAAGHAGVVAYLLEKGADPRERFYPDGTSLLDEAEGASFHEIAALLLRALEKFVDPPQLPPLPT